MPNNQINEIITAITVIIDVIMINIIAIIGADVSIIVLAVVTRIIGTDLSLHASVHLHMHVGLHGIRYLHVGHHWKTYTPIHGLFIPVVLLTPVSVLLDGLSITVSTIVLAILIL